MKKFILNSAVITTAGVYSYRLVDINQAYHWLSQGGWESTLGYKETAEALSLLTGISIPVNRRLIKMKEGDEALVFRLTVRLEDPNLKHKLSREFVLRNCEIGFLKKLRDYS